MNSCIVCLTFHNPASDVFLWNSSVRLLLTSSPVRKLSCDSFPLSQSSSGYFFIGTHKLMLYLFMFHNIPVSPFSPFSPFLPSLPSLPGIPTFPSAPGGPLGPGLPGRPGDPGTLQMRRGAPFSLVSNSCPKTQWHRQTTPTIAHIFKSVNANSKFYRLSNMI